MQLDEVSEVKQFKETQNVGEQDCQNGKDDQTYNIDMCINGFKLDANDTEILNDLDLKISVCLFYYLYLTLNNIRFVKYLMSWFIFKCRGDR